MKFRKASKLYFTKSIYESFLVGAQLTTDGNAKMISVMIYMRIFRRQARPVAVLNYCLAAVCIAFAAFDLKLDR